MSTAPRHHRYRNVRCRRRRESQPFWMACARADSCSSTAPSAARCGIIRGRSARTAFRWRAASEGADGGSDPHLDGLPPSLPSSSRRPPYIVALVDMDAGVRVNAPLRGIAENDLKIGQRVRLGFEPVNKEVTLPFFVAE